MTKIDQLIKLHRKATPGPWEAATEKDKHALVMALHGKTRADPDFYPTFVGWIPAPAPNAVNDAKFVVAARNALPKLLELYWASVRVCKPGMTALETAMHIQELNDALATLEEKA